MHLACAHGTAPPVASADKEAALLVDRVENATKYLVTGDQAREIWYDENGTWLQLRLESRGALVTMTRQ